MRHVLLLTPLSLSLLHRSLSTVDDMLSKRIDSNVEDGTRFACSSTLRVGDSCDGHRTGLTGVQRLQTVFSRAVIAGLQARGNGCGVSKPDEGQKHNLVFSVMSPRNRYHSTAKERTLPSGPLASGKQAEDTQAADA